jgi:hypothetical protein
MSFNVSVKCLLKSVSDLQPIGVPWCILPQSKEDETGVRQSAANY